MTSSQAGLLTAVFLASAVEFVEAFTIVLAMGLTRGWRSALWGAGAGVAVLAVVTAVAGYALVKWLPESALQLAVGTLLLIFGLQWLRKAILRAAGVRALHDEEEAFEAERAAALRAAPEQRMGLDWFAFVVSFKAVLLEGLEVVFIVITFGLNADSIPLAAAGAAAAGALVLATGAIAAPPARARAREHDQVRRRAAAVHVRDVLGGGGPGRRGRGQREPRVARRGPGDTGPARRLVVCLLPRGALAAPYGGDLMRWVRAFGRFWFDFVVGEDWRIAAGVVGVLGVGGLALRAELFSDSLLAVLVAAGIVAVAVASVVRAD